MNKSIQVKSVEELNQIVDYLISLSTKFRFFSLSGDLGSGKTTLIQKFCERLGVKDNVSSPTFSIVNEYMLNDQSIYHFDLYRINDLDELLKIGAEDYFLSKDLCFVEWPEIGTAIFPDEVVEIKISHSKDKREFEILTPD